MTDKTRCPSPFSFASSVRFVRWIDSSLQNVQVHVSDAPEPETITSVGFVVKETDEYVVLARDDHQDDDWRGLLAIPRCAILAEREDEARLLRDLFNEIDCRIEHGADSKGHLEYVHERLRSILAERDWA